MSQCRSTTVLCVAILGLFAASPAAATIIQADGVDFLGFEAENYDSLSGTGWIVVDTTPTRYSPDYDSTPGDDDPNDAIVSGLPVLPVDTNASGGKALLADFPMTTSTVTYQLTFKAEGTYYVYFHKSIFESGKNDNDTLSFGNEDSFHMSPDFDTAPGSDDVEDLSTTGAIPGNGVLEGQFNWEKAKLRTTDPSLAYTVDAADIDQVLSIEIQTRENGTALDYFILSTNGSLSDAELDQLMAVPEPSSLLLLLGGLLVAAGYCSFCRVPRAACQPVPSTRHAKA